MKSNLYDSGDVEMKNMIGKLAGRFIAFDGPDGSGKSTQIARFIKRARKAGLVVREVREPGGTSIGEQIREILLDPINTEMTLGCEMLLYMASRSQLVEREIKPALERSELVVADRFVSATLAYQGNAGGLCVEWIQAVAEVAVAGSWPDLTIILDVDDSVATKRLNPLLDRMELKGRAFHRLVREGFLEQAQMWPERYAVIDASKDADSVEVAVQNTIDSFNFCSNSTQKNGL